MCHAGGEGGRWKGGWEAEGSWQRGHERGTCWGDAMCRRGVHACGGSARPGGGALSSVCLHSRPPLSRAGGGGGGERCQPARGPQGNRGSEESCSFFDPHRAQREPEPGRAEPMRCRRAGASDAAAPAKRAQATAQRPGEHSSQHTAQQPNAVLSSPHVRHTDAICKVALGQHPLFFLVRRIQLLLAAHVARRHLQAGRR